jgi:hypothetical protein
MKALTRSIIEELLAALYLIAALLAWMADIHWLAIVLFIKAGVDTLCSMVAAVIAVKRKEA